MECSWDASLQSQRIHQLPPELQLAIQTTNPREYLEAFTRATHNAKCTKLILAHCEDFLPQICATLPSYGSLASSVATLGRIVPFHPHLIVYADKLLSQETSSPAHQRSNEDELLYLLGFFRLLAFDIGVMRKFIQSERLYSALRSTSRPIVYLAIRILQLYLSASDHWFEQIFVKYLGPDTEENGIEGQWDDIVIDYRFLTLWEEDRFEKLSMMIFEARMEISKTTNTTFRTIPVEYLDPSTALIGGILLPRVVFGINSESPTNSEIVFTSTATANLTRLARALKAQGPLLVKGLAGAGKTLFIRHAARCLGKLHDMVTLHLNEQSDAKSLLGIYTTGVTPGSFIWKAGVLTTAVREGRWILIENLDRAPHEILATLLPLIEKQQLTLPNRKETIHAAPGFRIIATLSTGLDHRGQETDPLSSMIGRRHWQSVHVQMASDSELQVIGTRLFPSLRPLFTELLAVYQQVKTVGDRPSAHGQSRTGALRKTSPRDLFKWCKRIDRNMTRDSSITSAEMDEMFLSAIDCFVGGLPECFLRSEVAAVVATELRIDPRRRDYVLHRRDVRYQCDKDWILVGQHRVSRVGSKRQSTASQSPFSTNAHTVRTLERVAVAITQREPLLLIGETGVGKTAAVQHLAKDAGKRLVPFNLSQQSEVADLLGGFKPISIRSLIVPLKDRFDELFSSSFSVSKNQQFLKLLATHFKNGKWTVVCKMWRQALKMVDDHGKTSANMQNENPSKKRKIEDRSIDMKRWSAFRDDLLNLERRIASGDRAVAFDFVEGNIIKAARNGDWVLLDEINLASHDTLEAIADLLDTHSPSIILADAGSVDRIEAHPEFRVFAAMNPATDVGKKDLPPGIRSSFTELYVESPDRDINSLQSIVRSYLKVESSTDTAVVADTSALYQKLVQLRDENKLADSAGQAAHFSLRTLTRTLTYAKDVAPLCNIRRALLEGFQMSFLTLLDGESARLVQPLFPQYLMSKRTSIKAELQKGLRQPTDGHQYLPGFPGSKHWIRRGRLEPQEQPHYILTPSVRTNLENLVRAASTRQFAVLLQGPTSSGKTSMIEYLAKRTGHNFVRINNHEHTDLQEYLGTYTSDTEGQLHFQEGPLVQALRRGDWVVLDELNLAPTDVLEALNRLLDDNRELMIPETQEVVRPHADFMLFATQNPAGLYGGRKVLSRAFRNRFLELHFDDIPVAELQEILHRRTQLPESWCRRIVKVYRELSILRQEARLFEQKSFATLRDLFRWAFRSNETIEDLANNGFMLLAERVRKADERLTLKAVIEKVLSENGPKVRIDEAALYGHESNEVRRYKGTPGASSVVWTRAMRRLYVLVSRAIANNEPVLLVGDTGCGKTTVCQMFAFASNKSLHTVNAHQTTETGDLIGSQRPVRNRAMIGADLRRQLLSTPALGGLEGAEDTSTEALIKSYDRVIANMEPAERHVYVQSIFHQTVQDMRTRFKALFEWSDGPLIHAMKSGSFFLLDEISLAEDSVLERLNSVLESGRSVLLAEKGTLDSSITAAPEFQFFATMNPGGDYGKKELSPALRNRFTEIWVPPLADAEDLEDIVTSTLSEHARIFSKPMVAFAQWFKDRYNTSASSSISVRDLLAWAHAVNSLIPGDLNLSVVHGAALVYIDTLGANPAGVMALSRNSIDEARTESLHTLGQFLNLDAGRLCLQPISVELSSDTFIAGPYRLHRAHRMPEKGTAFSFEPQTTRINTMRVVRAMQVSKSILLEGSPGVGKTALIEAIAKATGIPLTRINLSEQTDLTDLFGSDVPVEDGEIGKFTWQDAPFLRAMKCGEWVLLDEMNLASQSVLEGLNACLDHRGEVFIPELGQSFQRHPDFRLFAAQNPHHQGGGRKGLPSSFVNRFTVVFADAFRPEDLALISRTTFPTIEEDLLHKAVAFMESLEHQVSNGRVGVLGAPWEFNLRDLNKWFTLASADRGLLKSGTAQDFVDMLFSQRFRTASDRAAISALFERFFGDDWSSSDLFPSLSSQSFQLGLGLLPRQATATSHLGLGPQCRSSVGTAQCLQSLMLCVQQSWPVILTGSSGAGKTSLIEHLAATVGASVSTISMNAETDAMDLVGGYDQADSHRQVAAVLGEVRERLRSSALSALQSFSSSRHIEQSLAALKLVESDALNADQLASLSALLDHWGWSDIKIALQKAQIDSAGTEKARFEWFDGMLVEALQQGKWLVLDNANLCSPSVLDRLNSLLETDGLLIINEHNNADGSPNVLRSHPAFRIFMTLDPRYGELSRAMRNRAVEIHVSSDHGELATAEEAPGFESAIARLRQTKVLKRVLMQRPQPTGSLPDSLVPVLIDHLGLQDEKLIFRFARQLKTGLYSGMPEVTDKLSHALLHSQSQRHDDMHKIYASIVDQLQASTDLAIVQTLHPLNNQALVQFSSQVLESAQSLAIIHEAGVRLSANANILLTIDNDTDTLSKIRRFERSLNINNAPLVSKSNSCLLARIVGSMDAYLRAWFSAQSEVLPKAQLSLARALVGRLCALCETIQSTLAQHASDGPFLLGLLLAGRELLEEVAVFQKPNSAASLVKQVALSVTSVLPSAKSIQGCAITSMWQALRPPTPTTYEQLEDLLKLKAITDKFDSACGQMSASVSSMVELRMSLSRALDLASAGGQDARQLCERLEDWLPESDDPGTTPSRQPHFLSAYRTLCEQLSTLALGGSEVVPHKTMTTLALLGKYSTKAGIDRPLHSGFTPIQTQFNLLHARSDCMLEALQVRANDAHSSGDILGSLRAIDQVQLQSLDLLKAELQIVGATLASNAHVLGANSLATLNLCLEHLVRGLLQSLMSSSDDPELQQVASKLWTLLDCGTAEAAVPETTQSLTELVIDSQVYMNGSPFLTLREIVNHLRSTSYREDEERCARAFVAFACVCLRLYVPELPFDPAIDAWLKREMHRRQYTSISSQLHAAQHFRKALTGTTGKLRVTLLENDLHELGTEPTLPQVYRPEISQMQQMRGDLDAVIRLSNKLWDDLESQSTFTPFERSTVDNIMQLRTRLVQSHRAYDDFKIPIVGFLDCLLTGHFFARHGARQQNSTSANLTDLVPFADASTTSWLKDTTFLKVNEAISTHVEIVSWLRMVDFRSQVVSIQDCSRDLRTAVQTRFHGLYIQWQRRLDEEHRKEVSKSSLYRFKGTEEDGDPTEDDVNEYFSLEATTRPEGKTLANDREAATEVVARLHEAIFRGRGPDTLNLATLLRQSGSGIQDSFSSWTQYAEYLPAVLLLLHEESTSTLGDTPKPQYNLYEDSNIGEAEKLLSILTQASRRFREIRSAWPEHATPQIILRLSSNIQILSHRTPLARFLPKVEELHAAVHEWQKIASREFSAIEIYNDLTSLIVSWRQLELSSWVGLFRREKELCNRMASSWWYIAYEAIILGFVMDNMPAAELQANLQKLLQTLADFLTSCGLGEFHTRLQMLRAFEAHAAIMAKDHTPLGEVSRAIHNLVSYFANYEKAVEETLATRQVVLEKEMKSLIQVASWKDRNVDVLRQNAASSHKKLLRIVKKYRRLLSEPVASIINGDFPKNSAEDQAAETAWSSRNAVQLHMPEVDEATMSIVGTARIQRLRMVLSTTEEASARTETLVRTFAAGAQLSSFAKSLSASIHELQAATPATLTDKNQSFVNHLKTRKRRLLADVLKDLRRMGFQPTMSQQALADQESLSQVLARIPGIYTDEINPTIKSAQHEFHRLLSIMSKVRDGVAKSSDDLTSAEVKRCATLLESILQTAIVQHGRLCDQLSQVAGLKEAVDSLDCFANCDAPVVLSGQDKDHPTQLARLSCVEIALQSCICVLRAQRDLSGNDYADLISLLERTLVGIAEYRHVSKSPLGLPSSVWKSSIPTARQYLLALTAEIEVALEEGLSLHPELGPVASQLKKWLQTDSSSDAEQHANGFTTIDLKNWIETSLAMSERRVHSTTSLEGHVPADRKKDWVTGQQKSMRETFDALGLDEASEQLSLSLRDLQHLQSSDGTALLFARNVCRTLRPIHDAHLHLAKELTETSAKLLQQLSSFGHMLATVFVQLTARGFCAPSEQSNEETNAKGAAESGTGLGDGEGAEDISKDIADDEDLSELPQKADNTQDQEGIEDEKDAVDMADEEFEGAMGDVSESNEEDQDDAMSDTAEDQPDVEEEAGDLGSEASAQEEKTWDAAGDENEKRGESDSSKGQKQTDELAAGKEDGNKSPQSQEDDDAEGEEDAGSGMDEIDQQEAAVDDSHARQEETLELPEDMKFGEQESMKSEESGDDDAQDDNMEDVDQASEVDGVADPLEEDGTNDDHEDSREADTNDNDTGADGSDEPQQEEDLDTLMAESKGTEADATAEEQNTGRGTSRADASVAQNEMAVDRDLGEDGTSEDVHEQVSANDNNGQGQEGQQRTDTDKSTNGRQQPRPMDDNNPFQKLGDALREWYNQRQAIENASKPSKDSSANREQQLDASNARFEHLPDDDTEEHAQALGAASAAQAAPLDEEHALQKKDELDAFEADSDVEEDGRTRPDNETVESANDGTHDAARGQQQAGDSSLPSKPDRSGYDESEDVEMESPLDDDQEDESSEMPPQAQENSSDVSAPEGIADGAAAWAGYEEKTRNLAFTLTERLRLILQPTQATKMRGDFRTGKRLNIKRIIPYIASSYKRDKIWMRRSIPSKRSYQVMLAIDDSKSMAESENRHLAFETLALITKSMSMLEVGELSVVGFGEDFKLVQDFTQHYSTDAGIDTLKKFTFAQDKTNVLRLLRGSIELFRQARLKASGSSRDLWQLQLIISDGICEDHASIRQLVRQAQEERIMIVFIVVDATTKSVSASGVQQRSSQSVLELQTAEFVKDASGEMQLRMVKYLDTFPFQYYLIVRDVHELPGVLAGALQQWFAEVTNLSS